MLRKWQRRRRSKNKNQGTDLVEKFGEKARKDAGIEEVEEHDMKLKLTSIIKKKKELQNKEDADFNEQDEVYHDNDDDDKALFGNDFLSDSDSDDAQGISQSKGKVKPKLLRKNTHLNEDVDKI